jgi:hypothetical protein
MKTKILLLLTVAVTALTVSAQDAEPTASSPSSPIQPGTAEWMAKAQAAQVEAKVSQAKETERRQKLLPPLLEIARKDSVESVRQEALASIAWLELTESIEPLCAIVLADASENIRLRALEMVSNFHSDASRAGLIKIYDRLPSETLKQNAIYGLYPQRKSGGTNALPKLVEIAYQETSVHLANLALDAIAHAPTEEAARLLSERFDKAKTYDQKLNCLIGLSQNACLRQAAKLLDVAQHDADPQLRGAAVAVIAAGLHGGIGQRDDFSRFAKKIAPAPTAPQ